MLRRIIRRACRHGNKLGASGAFFFRMVEALADWWACLSDEKQIGVANKIDALDDPDRLKKLAKHLKKYKVPLYPISAVTGEGLPALLEAMWTP